MRWAPTQRWQTRGRALLGCALAVSVGACAPQFPETRVERALVRDLARVVDVKARTGWFIDETEIGNAMNDAMKSVCQVPDPNRRAALAWLDQQIADNGGDIAALWRKNNRDLSALGDLQRWTRVRLLLTRADDWVAQGRCPFWLEASPRFAGVNSQDHRFVVSIEGGGRVTLERLFGASHFGGGGSGRLLGGWGVSDEWALLAGFEFGGDARFTNLALGEVQLPKLVGFGALPVVARHTFGLSEFVEFETGPLASIDRGSASAGTVGMLRADSVLGMRFGLAFGANYLRLQQSVIPKFAVSFTVDYIPPQGGNHPSTLFGLGVRTGLDLSTWRSF